MCSSVCAQVGGWACQYIQFNQWVRLCKCVCVCECLHAYISECVCQRRAFTKNIHKCKGHSPRRHDSCGIGGTYISNHLAITWNSVNPVTTTPLAPQVKGQWQQALHSHSQLRKQPEQLPMLNIWAAFVLVNGKLRAGLRGGWPKADWISCWQQWMPNIFWAEGRWRGEASCIRDSQPVDDCSYLLTSSKQHVGTSWWQLVNVRLKWNNDTYNSTNLKTDWLCLFSFKAECNHFDM